MSSFDRVSPVVGAPTVARQVIYRHRLPTRIWHWLNAAVILVMLMSGLMIFNAYSRLDWGQYGANPDYSWLQIGDRGEQGYLRVGDPARPGSWAPGADQAIRRYIPLSPAGSPYRPLTTSHWRATGT
jgi:hypothetical protein